jgi:hypothetical protein
MKNKTIEQQVEEFNKEFVVYHSGDSGMGGNTPQEPVYEIQYENPNEIIDWIKQALLTAEKRERERIFREYNVQRKETKKEKAQSDAWNDLGNTLRNGV